MNVSGDTGSIIAFRDAWAGSDDSEQENVRPDDKWLDYCRARERAERAAAKAACSDAARRAHQELALAYAQTVQAADGRRG